MARTREALHTIARKNHQTIGIKQKCIGYIKFQYILVKIIEFVIHQNISVPAARLHNQILWQLLFNVTCFKACYKRNRNLT